MAFQRIFYVYLQSPLYCHFYVFFRNLRFVVAFLINSTTRSFSCCCKASTSAHVHDSDTNVTKTTRPNAKETNKKKTKIKKNNKNKHALKICEKYSRKNGWSRHTHTLTPAVGVARQRCRPRSLHSFAEQQNAEATESYAVATTTNMQSQYRQTVGTRQNALSWSASTTRRKCVGECMCVYVCLLERK